MRKLREYADQVTPKMREKVFERDGYQCRYCGTKTGPFEIDHVYPVSEKGLTCIDNLAVACKTCNNKKNAKIGVWPRPVGYWDTIQEAKGIIGQKAVIRRQKDATRWMGKAFMLLGLFLITFVPMTVKTHLTVATDGLVYPPRDLFTLFIVIGLVPLTVGAALWIASRNK